MSGAGGSPDVNSPRDLGALLRDAFGRLAARPLSFLATGLAFSVPIQLAVSGLGLEQLTSPYSERVQVVETVVGTLTSYVLVTPLISVACALLVVGTVATAGRGIVAAVERSTPLLLAAIAAAAGVAVGLLLVIPGLYLVVRWFLFPQAVAIEEQTGTGPLRRSGELVQGRWFRAAGVILVANLLALLPGALITVPFQAWGASIDQEWPVLTGMILAESVTAPVVAVVATLLFFDLRARQAQPF